MASSNHTFDCILEAHSSKFIGLAHAFKLFIADNAWLVISHAEDMMLTHRIWIENQASATKQIINPGSIVRCFDLYDRSFFIERVEHAHDIAKPTAGTIGPVGQLRTAFQECECGGVDFLKRGLH